MNTVNTQLSTIDKHLKGQLSQLRHWEMIRFHSQST